MPQNFSDPIWKPAQKIASGIIQGFHNAIQGINSNDQFTLSALYLFENYDESMQELLTKLNLLWIEKPPKLKEILGPYSETPLAKPQNNDADIGPLVKKPEVNTDDTEEEWKFEGFKESPATTPPEHIVTRCPHIMVKVTRIKISKETKPWGYSDEVGIAMAGFERFDNTNGMIKKARWPSADQSDYVKMDGGDALSVDKGFTFNSHLVNNQCLTDVFFNVGLWEFDSEEMYQALNKAVTAVLDLAKAAAVAEEAGTGMVASSAFSLIDTIINEILLLVGLKNDFMGDISVRFFGDIKKGAKLKDLTWDPLVANQNDSLTHEFPNDDTAWLTHTAERHGGKWITTIKVLKVP